ncbi:MAG: hypothetical protein HYV47_02675 [Candidatus Nealsonbacteria bacterium]|nr:hypothetical protein [Candidatus Nealsonbacteria bacterium]
MDYISLKEATKYCDYSQDYLKLRARQGKFKAVKFGRNWVTTVDWVREYNGHDRVIRSVIKKYPVLVEKHRVLAQNWLKLVTFLVGAGLAAYLIFLLLDLGYFELNIKNFLANIGSLIPGRVVEIK